MLRTRRLLLPRRFYAEIDYAMHMPKAYTDRMERKIPKKVYDNRFGAPPVTLWKIHPDNNQELLTKTMEDGAELMQTKRPWEVDKVQQTLSREREYKRALFSTKFLQKAHREVPVIPAEEWTFFQGDLVVVMVGRDKGKAGFISHVIREENAVFVEGLNTKPIQKMSKEMVKTMGYKSFDQWEEQPLFVHRGQVRLVDPNDDEPCTAKWILNDSKTSYIRVSIRTGYEIPLPKTAYRTYEYAAPAAYIEVPSKDTPANTVLKQTYVPKLCTFEQEIEEQSGLEKHPTQQEKPPTFWY